MNSSDAGTSGMIVGVFAIIIVVGMIASMWKVFAKAGQPGWAAIVPIYNLIILLQISGKPSWWLVLFLIPLVNFAALILVAISLAKSFGKTTGFGLGLAFLGFVFYPILGFGSAQYMGPAGTGAPVLATIQAQNSHGWTRSVVAFAAMPPCVITTGSFPALALGGTKRLIWYRPIPPGVKPTKGVWTGCPSRVIVTCVLAFTSWLVGAGVPDGTFTLVAPKPTR
jgi:hypothetical protein